MNQFNYLSEMHRLIIILALLLGVASLALAQGPITPVNLTAISQGTSKIAITNVRIIDGTGGPVIENGTVLVDQMLIVDVGDQNDVEIPQGYEMFDGRGMSVLPGLLDAHFHLNNKIVNSFLRQGITSLRDPGAWIESYNNVRASGQHLPRLFLTGPHFDMGTPAYPKNSVIVRDPLEADQNVRLFANTGASAIKIYFRCTPAIIKQVCETADELGIPVTAHLEITDIYQAIDLGLDGIEHITSLGSNLIPKPQAETYRQQILADNSARRDGRYLMWSEIDQQSDQANKLAELLADRGTYVCPTLGAFEYRFGKEKNDTVRVSGFAGMMNYTQMLHEKGVNLVVGSHTYSPYDKVDGAYHNEMELWAEAGIPAADIIVAATSRNAQFFRVDEKLGSITSGKIADLLIVDGNPLDSIEILRKVYRVMQNGVWIE